MSFNAKIVVENFMKKTIKNIIDNNNEKLVVEYSGEKLIVEKKMIVENFIEGNDETINNDFDCEINKKVATSFNAKTIVKNFISEVIKKIIENVIENVNEFARDFDELIVKNETLMKNVKL